MKTTNRLASLLLALFALAPCGAEVVVSPPDWKPEGEVRLDQPLVKTFTVSNHDSKPVTIVSFSGSRKAQIQLERTVLPPNSDTKMTVSIPLAGTDDASSILKGQILLLLDSDQDNVTVPFEMTLAGIDTAPEVLPQRAPYIPSPEDQPVEIMFFYDGTCGKCEAFIQNVLEPCQKHFAKAKVTFTLRSYRDEKVLFQLEEYKARYQLTEEASTYLFCGEHAYAGNADIETHLYGMIESELKHPTRLKEAQGPVLPAGTSEMPAAGLAASPGEQRVREEFEHYTAPVMLLGGMVDGINPCAIAMAVFLIVMLTKFGHDRTSLLAAGGAYAAAVFVTYFLVGLALLKSITLFGSRQLPGQLLNGAVGVASLAFAGLQLRDVARLRSGAGTRELTMQLPLKLKQLSHKFVREGVGRPAVVVGSVVAGVLVTLLEAVCTGQMYVPVLTTVAGMPELKARAMTLLAFYNLGFVMPLLAILAMTYQGVTSESLAAAAKRHVVPAKLALAALLGVLGVALVGLALHPH